MSRLSEITDVIFDLDGTLVDSAPAIMNCFKAAFERQNVQAVVPLSQVSIIGPPLRDTLRLLAGGNDEDLIDRLAATFAAEYDGEGFRKTIEFPGASETLSALKHAGLRLHLATNKRLRPTQLILQLFHWTPHFESIYALDLISPAFPNKSEMLKAQLSDAGLVVRSTVYVGDTLQDKQAGDNNGLSFIAASWGYQAGASWLNECVRANRPADLMQLIGPPK